MYPRSVPRKLRVLMLLLMSTLFLPMIICFVAPSSALAASPHVDVAVLNTDIGPASLRFLTQAIATAKHDGAQALVLEVDTPGGDIGSMKSMTEAELNSSVPIISYVTPSGAYAASAGAFVTLAAHIAAMAPTTRIGASSPVDSSGGDIGNTLKMKIENDLVASMTGIQSRYGRSVDPALKMITEAKSYDNTEAV
ncbi:MAG: nodulation protein NfeD, partial [Chloroflexota bacterium]|nr:nodulation protein NfeD [Chloroflexota bacterium]